MTKATLPLGARPYRRTDIFSETTIPPGLLKAYSTKDGAWALIHVLEGLLAHKITDPRRPPSTRGLTPRTSPGVVEPTILHEVRPLGPTQFFVEFHRLEGG